MDKVVKYGKVVAMVLGFVVMIGGALVPGFKEAVCGGAPAAVASPVPSASPATE